MFKWTNGSVIVVTGWLLGGCAGVSPEGAEAELETSSQDLIAARRCRSENECPVPLVACRQCPDGVNFSCPEPVCQAGRCGVTFTPCPEDGLIFCGGIAGFPCPSGFECVDDPRDDCSPCRGGADCGGICVELSCKPECDPTLICTQALTCVDGQLYPTGCGPRNCDTPIGDCAALQ
jgi:hypothetical protein